MENTIVKVAVPVSVTALTTVSGFAALMVSLILAVKELGLYSSIGIIVINLFALTWLLPSCAISRSLSQVCFRCKGIQ